MTRRATAAIANADRVAALLMSIDGRQAARVLHGLQPAEFRRVTAAINKLRAAPLDHAATRAVFVDAVGRLQRRPVADRREVAVGAEDRTAADGSAGEAASDPDPKPCFAVFERLNAEDLAILLADEHPQIAAVFIAHLDRQKAAEVLREMPQERRPDLVYRIATLDRTPLDVIDRILDALTKKVENLGIRATRRDPQAWIAAAADILKHIGDDRDAILVSIGENNEGIAGSIRDQLFTFNDLEQLSRRSMQRVLALTDSRTLALALKDASPAVEANVFDNLTRRAGAMVAEERDLLGKVPVSRVRTAQRKLLGIVRSLMEDGAIPPPNVAPEPMI